MNIKAAVVAGITGIALITGAGLLAFAPGTGAQEPEATPSTQRETRRQAFLEAVAANLGVETAQLEQAIKDAKLDMVDQALAEGRITEEQAAKARERIESGERLRGPRERQGNHARREQIRAGIIAQAAEAIGITGDELRASLRAGNSIADEAASRGVALDDVKAAILEGARAKLDAAVANGRIDQARADELLAGLESRLDEILTRKRTTAPAP